MYLYSSVIIDSKFWKFKFDEIVIFKLCYE